MRAIGTVGLSFGKAKSSGSPSRGHRRGGCRRTHKGGDNMLSRNDRIAKQLGITAGQVLLLKSARALTNEALEQLPAHTLRRALRRLDYSDMPGEREWFKHLQHRTVGPMLEML